MFKLLSNESNIFSIPVYLIFLGFVIFTFNVLDFSLINSLSAFITFAGIALAYFLFNTINLTYQTHIPLFLYTILVFALLPGTIDIGIAVSLFTNSFILLMLTSTDDQLKRNSQLLIGSILAINFIFLPTTWPLMIFVLIHILFTSDRIAQSIFKLFFGMLIIAFSYFCVMFYLHYTTWDPQYFPFSSMQLKSDYYPLTLLSPVALLTAYSVMDHFKHFNKKSPKSKFKYSFVLVFSLAQLVTICLYMDTTYEYLLLLAFPISIILCRGLHFMPKYWYKEVSLWVIICSLLLFKAATYIELF